MHAEERDEVVRSHPLGDVFPHPVLVGEKRIQGMVAIKFSILRFFLEDSGGIAVQAAANLPAKPCLDPPTPQRKRHCALAVIRQPV